MKLITAEIEKQLLKSPFYSTEKEKKSKVIVKFFTPWSNWTWYAVEGEKTENGDWEFFGLVEGHERELGYFTLSELQEVRGPFGLKIERDMFFENRYVDKENMRVVGPEVGTEGHPGFLASPVANVHGTISVDGKRVAPIR